MKLFSHLFQTILLLSIGLSSIWHNHAEALTPEQIIEFQCTDSKTITSPTYPATTTVGVYPYVCDSFTIGDAAKECVTNLGYDFGLKIDNWNNLVTGDFSCDDGGDVSCEVTDNFKNTITISNNDGTYFDWSSSPFPLGAVVVKGGPAANIFEYNPAASADSDLYSPANPSGGFADISHASFCWNMSDNGGKCYQEETAWAVGYPYNTRRGNWAMYVPYHYSEVTYDIRAGGGDGVGLDAGTVTLKPLGGNYVEISVNLENGFIFYYDLNNDEEDNNLKVQDYSSAPSGNPKIGKFEYKTFIAVGSTSGVIVVEKNKYYGIHLDVAYEIDCHQ